MVARRPLVSAAGAHAAHGVIIAPSMSRVLRLLARTTLVLVASLALLPAQEPPESLRPARALAVERVAQGVTPSLAVAVVDKEKTLWAEAFGPAAFPAAFDLEGFDLAGFDLGFLI